MATIIKNGNKWRVQIRKKGIYKAATFSTKTEANRWAYAIEAQIDAGEYNTIPNILFAELIDKYLKEVTPTKRGQREERFRLLRIARSSLGNITLPELTKEHFRKWQNQRLQEVQPVSVARERATLSALMTKALEWDYLKENPLKTLEKLKTPPARTRRYSEEEIDKLIFVSGYGPTQPPLLMQNRVGAAILFAIETAMRAGEITGLKWEHVKLDQRTAYLPKTKNGYARTVPLSTKAVEILKHLSQLEQDKDNSVFQLSSRSLDAIFRNLKRKANLHEANLHFHDTRREALTRLSKYLSVMDLAKVSGHRDINMLQNTYYNPDISELVSKLQ
ncbi:integrase [Mannheimia granulomatis]|uniref:Integrase n=1 Tax=Mannheimia granulomatis TaxID=85402 RepID=A0A011P559_9PAST|nr:site-specific integrase [Mannheimia granulomatis]EXI61644.1 integrase [Mannheimia granulomatis]RGE48286.1 integrase [Mannheimia granulomatis]